CCHRLPFLAKLWTARRAPWSATAGAFVVLGGWFLSGLVLSHQVFDADRRAPHRAVAAPALECFLELPERPPHEHAKARRSMVLLCDLRSRSAQDRAFFVIPLKVLEDIQREVSVSTRP